MSMRYEFGRFLGKTAWCVVATKRAMCDLITLPFRFLYYFSVEPVWSATLPLDGGDNR